MFRAGERGRVTWVKTGGLGWSSFFRNLYSTYQYSLKVNREKGAPENLTRGPIISLAGSGYVTPYIMQLMQVIGFIPLITNSAYNKLKLELTVHKRKHTTHDCSTL